MLTEQIKKIAEDSGIDLIGITDASPFENYIFENSIRKNPGNSLKSARSIIVAAVYIGGMVLPVWEDSSYGRTSRLYLSGFFLDVIKPLKPIASFLEEQGYKARICDSSRNETSILPLKLAAVRAGMGWQGKHSLLISEKYGSYMALGGILTDAELKCNETPIKNNCGSCNECRKACPVNALSEPFILNRNLCLSNVLQADSLKADAGRKAENRVGDCEICQDACPWNRKHRTAPLQTELSRQFQTRLSDLSEKSRLDRLINMDEESYRREWSRYRTDIPFPVFRRNIKNALSNKESDL